jgi:hypothetical protein
VPRKIVTALAVFIFSFMFLGSWAISNPVGSSPDEGSHLVGIWCTELNKSIKCNNLNGTANFSSKLSGDDSCYLHDADQSANCLKEQEEIYKELSGFTELKFYKFFSYFISDNVEYSVILMRLFNVLIFSICILFSYLFLRQDIFIGTMFSFMIVGLPLGLYLATSISTSSWLILGAIFFIPFVIEILSNLRTRAIPLILLTIILIYLYTGSRQDGILFLGISLVSSAPIIIREIFNMKYLSKLKENRKYYRLVWTTSIFVIFYGVYYVSSEIGKRAGLGSYASTQAVTNWDIAYRFTSLISGALGAWGLGSLEVDMPDFVTFSSIIIFFSVIFISLKQSIVGTKLTLALYSYFLIYVIWMFLFKSQLYVGQWLQPRYIIPIMFSLVSLSFVGIKPELYKSYIPQIRIIVFLSTICFAFSLHTNLRRYTHGLDQLYVNLDKNNEWWWDFLPISPMQVLFIGILSYFATWTLLINRVKTNQVLIQSN